jgi:hypothetical protein
MIQSNGMADDLSWKAVTIMRIGGLHPASLLKNNLMPSALIKRPLLQKAAQTLLLRWVMGLSMTTRP